jgi:PAS domain-containing protein
MLAGSVLLVQFLLRYKQAFRRQMVALLIGLLAPWICNLLYLTGVNPLPNFDLTLLGFTITGLAVSLALLRYRFLDILPVAHSSLIENMSDGLLVMDDQNRIVEVNPAAAILFNLPLNKLLTLPVSLALSQYPDFLDKIENIRDGKAEVAFSNLTSGKQHIFELRFLNRSGTTERENGHPERNHRKDRSHRAASRPVGYPGCAVPDFPGDRCTTSIASAAPHDRSQSR